MTIAIIGCGNIGEAVLAGALAAGFCEPGDVTVTARRPGRVAELADRHGVAGGTDNATAVADRALIVVGVTPEAVPAVLAGVRDHLSPGAVVLSLAAGVGFDALAAALPGVALARALPSVAAAVGHGITGFAVRGATAAQAGLARGFLAASGEAIDVDEAGLGPIGSLAGSGPAYVALVAGALQAGGVELGLPTDEARRLTLETIAGTLALLRAGATPETIAAQVGHEGGSTIRAVAHLRDTGALAAVTAAVSHSFES